MSVASYPSAITLESTHPIPNPTANPPPSLPNPKHPPYIKNYKKGYANVRTSFKLHMLVVKRVSAVSNSTHCFM